MTNGAIFRCWISGLISPKMVEQLTGNKTCILRFVHNGITAENSPKSSEVIPSPHVTGVRAASSEGFSSRVEALHTTSPESARLEYET